MTDADCLPNLSMDNFYLRFIDEHYIGAEKDELLGLLETHGLTEVLDKVVAGHEKGLMIKGAQGVGKVAPWLSSFASTTLIAINQRIGTVTDPAEKAKIKTMASGLALRLFLSLVRQFPDEIIEALPTIESTLLNTCQMMGYDYDDLKTYFNPEQIRFLVREISGASYATMKPLPQYSYKRLVWTEKENLNLLSYELKKRDWIRSKKQWFDFLDKNRIPQKVACNENFKCHLAYLLFVLYEGGYIQPKGSKGYFTIAEACFEDYSNRAFAKDSLKKLSYKVNGDRAKHADVIGEAEGILASIKARTKVLL